MLTVQNSIAIKLGNIFQGTAEGPLGIGAFLLIAAGLFALAVAQRRS